MPTEEAIFVRMPRGYGAGLEGLLDWEGFDMAVEASSRSMSAMLLQS
jgi:hypothetical protein